jgi:hypothetical protein
VIVEVETTFPVASITSIEALLLGKLITTSPDVGFG